MNKNQIKTQGNGSATIARSQNGRALAGEPPAPTRTTTASTPGALNSDLVNTDNSDTPSEQHEGSPSQPESDEVKKRRNAELRAFSLFTKSRIRIDGLYFSICVDI